MPQVQERNENLSDQLVSGKEESCVRKRLERCQGTSTQENPVPQLKGPQKVPDLHSLPETKNPADVCTSALAVTGWL